MTDNPSDRPFLRSEDEVDVVGKNRTRVNRVISFRSSDGKSISDRGNLIVRKAHRRVLQRAFGGAAQFAIVGNVGNRRARIDFRCSAIAEEFPRPDEVGPGTARIVGS